MLDRRRGRSSVNRSPAGIRSRRRLLSITLPPTYPRRTSKRSRAGAIRFTARRCAATACWAKTHSDGRRSSMSLRPPMIGSLISPILLPETEPPVFMKVVALPAPPSSRESPPHEERVTRHLSGRFQDLAQSFIEGSCLEPLQHCVDLLHIEPRSIPLAVDPILEICVIRVLRVRQRFE